MIYNCGDGVGVAFSPDGLHWKPEPDMRVAKVSDSPHSVMWEPRLNATWPTAVSGRRLSSPTVTVMAGRAAWGTRVVLQSESEDFVNWDALWDHHGAR